MGLFQNLNCHVFSCLLIITLFFVSSRAIEIEVLNNCTYTVWAAAQPGGGKELKQGDSWILSILGSGSGRIWGRTKCSFGLDGQQNYCESGDCDGRLECQANGRAPNTVAEYSINQADGEDNFYISVVEGFNIPMQFSPASSSNCRHVSGCDADVNGPCPMELRDPGGCNNPCTVFSNDQFCCLKSICEPTSYSQFFNDLCPGASIYPSDVGQRRTCPTGTHYKVVFCPLMKTTGVNAAKVTIKNNCDTTIWPATLTGDQKTQLSTTGFELGQGLSQTVEVRSPWSGRFWARSRCSTNSGKFTCVTGDCGSGQVECNGAGGAPPATIVEITIAENGGQDFYDVSNVDGFNLRVSVVPQSGTGDCKESSCPVDLNVDCPAELQLKDSDGTVVGCKSACLAFNEDKYCCRNAYGSPDTCPPTNYSQFFEEKCPLAYSYAYDDASSTFTCSGRPDYLITFCP